MKNKVLPGLEPGLQGSKPWVLTNYTIEPELKKVHRGAIPALKHYFPKQNIFEARIELATSSVLDWRDNQLHHPNSSSDGKIRFYRDLNPDYKDQNLGC